MALPRLLLGALGLLVVLAGCDSPDKAKGQARAGRKATPRRRTHARRRRPPTPAEKMARIDERLAHCGDFDRRIAAFRDDLARLARAATPVAGLRASLDEVDRLRAASVHVMGRRVGVWTTICRVSPGADALNPAIAKADKVVRRCEQIVRLQAVVASDCRVLNGALAKARARPSEPTLAALGDAAAGLRTRIALVQKTRSDLDGALALIAKPLRAARDALNAVTAAAVRDQARAMAYRVGRVLAVTTSARSRLRQRRSAMAEVTATLSAIAVAAGKP